MNVRSRQAKVTISPEELERLRLKLLVSRAAEDVDAGNLEAAWNRLNQDEAELLNRDDSPELEEVRHQFLLLRMEITIRTANRLWLKGRWEAARRWLARGEAIRRGAPEYTPPKEQEELWKRLRQRLREPPQDSGRQFMEELDAAEQSARHVLSQDSPVATRRDSTIALGRAQPLQQLQSEVVPDLGFNLVDDLSQEFDERIRRLSNEHHQRSRAAEISRLRQAWPQSTAELAGPEVYRLVSVCKSSAREHELNGWDELRASLDRHNAQFYFEMALDAAGDDKPLNRERIADCLRRAVAWEPSMAPQAAMLVGLMCIPSTIRPPLGVERLQEEMCQYAGRLVEFTDPSTVDSTEHRERLSQEAKKGFSRVCRVLRIHCAPQRGPRHHGVDIRTMTHVLTRVLTPVLDHGDSDQLKSTSELAGQWQAACLARFDPRHPCHRLRRDVEIAIRLRRAEDLLRGDADEPLPEFEQTVAIRTLIAEVIELGLSRPRQLLRATKAFAIAESRGSSHARQRQVVARVLEIARRQLRERKTADSTTSRSQFSKISFHDLQRWFREASMQATSMT